MGRELTLYKLVAGAFAYLCTGLQTTNIWPVPLFSKGPKKLIIAGTELSDRGVQRHF